MTGARRGSPQPARLSKTNKSMRKGTARRISMPLQSLFDSAGHRASSFPLPLSPTADSYGKQGSV